LFYKPTTEKGKQIDEQMKFDIGNECPPGKEGAPSENQPIWYLIDPIIENGI
jgi:hypothetical protein